MLTLKKVKELVEAPSHAKRTPSPKMLFEEGIVLLRREFDQGSHLTVYNSGYVLFSAGKRNTVFHIHDCCGDYAYDAAEGKGDVIKEEYFENCEWHIRALFEGERKMEDNQAKCEGAGRSNVCVSYHALSEDWSEIADRTINMLEKIIENGQQNSRKEDIMKAIRWLLKSVLVIMTLPLILTVWLIKWFVVFLHHCSAWIFYLLGSVLLATAILSYLMQQSQGMEALQMLIGGFAIFMIPQVVGSVVVLLELVAVMLRQVWYI